MTACMHTRRNAWAEMSLTLNERSPDESFEEVKSVQSGRGSSSIRMCTFHRNQCEGKGQTRFAQPVDKVKLACRDQRSRAWNLSTRHRN